MATDPDDDSRRAAIGRQIQLASEDPIASHEIYHDDAVLEFPQSGERFEGIANFRQWRSEYPAAVEFEVRRISGSGDVWVRELSVRYDGGPWMLVSRRSSSAVTASLASASTSPSHGRHPTGERAGAAPRAPSDPAAETG